MKAIMNNKNKKSRTPTSTARKTSKTSKIKKSNSLKAAAILCPAVRTKK